MPARLEIKSEAIKVENKEALRSSTCGYKVFSRKEGAPTTFDGSWLIFNYPSNQSLYIEKKIREKIEVDIDYKCDLKADEFILIKRGIKLYLVANKA